MCAIAIRFSNPNSIGFDSFRLDSIRFQHSKSKRDCNDICTLYTYASCNSENVALRLLFWFDSLFVCSVVVCIFGIVSSLSLRFFSFISRLRFYCTDICLDGKRLKLQTLREHRSATDVRSFLTRISLLGWCHPFEQSKWKIQWARMNESWRYLWKQQKGEAILG